MLVCVLDREEEMLFHVSYGVVCGQRTVAACCEIKTGLEWGSLMNFGSRGTRNAAAPPFGTLDSEARISGPKSSHESGTVCLAPHWLLSPRDQNTIEVSDMASGLFFAPQCVAASSTKVSFEAATMCGVQRQKGEGLYEWPVGCSPSPSATVAFVLGCCR